MRLFQVTHLSEVVGCPHDQRGHISFINGHEGKQSFPGKAFCPGVERRGGPEHDRGALKTSPPFQGPYRLKAIEELLKDVFRVKIDDEERIVNREDCFYLFFDNSISIKNLSKKFMLEIPLISFTGTDENKKINELPHIIKSKNIDLYKQFGHGNPRLME